MITEISDVRAKGRASQDYVIELLQSARISKNPSLVKRFLRYLGVLSDSSKKVAIDLNEIYHFVIYCGSLLLIPKGPFAANEVVVIKNGRAWLDFKAEKIEFDEDDYSSNPNLFLPGFLRACLKRVV